MANEKIKADLIDIEVSALELSVGNFEADKFESDCQHIATLAYKIRDHLFPNKTEKEQV